MKFLYPDMLWGLLALAIPILVHLFNFRRFKKVLFSNVEFLRDIKQETQSKSKLRHLLILLSRLLAIAAIVFAFAQPYLPLSNQNSELKSKEVSIYVDNSFSMESEQESGRLLDIAKNKALEIVDIYDNTDKFQILTNDFEGRHQRLLSKEEIIEWIPEIDLSPNKKMISEVLSRQEDLLLENMESAKVSYVISDLQKTTHDFQNTKIDTNITVRLVPTLSDQNNNCYIDTAWLETPVRQINKVERLNIKLINNSNKKVKNLPVNLFINDNPKAVGSFDIPENGAIDTVLTFKNTSAGFKSARIEIQDYPVVFDNNYYFTYEVTEKINVLEIRGNGIKNTNIAKVFDNDDNFEFQLNNELNLDYGTLKEKDFIVLNGLNVIQSGLSNELKKFVSSGGSVYLIPSANGSIEGYNSFIQSVEGPGYRNKINAKNEVSKLNKFDPIYAEIFNSIPSNLDLPKANSYYEIYASVNNSSRNLLEFRDGKPFLSVNDHKLGKFYLNAVSLNTSQSNFSQHAIFVATLVRMAEFSQWNAPMEYEIGGQQVVTMKSVARGNEEIFKIKNTKTNFEFLPGVRSLDSQTELFVYDQIKEAGAYEVELADELISKLAFNFSREESDLKSYTLEEVSEKVSNLQNFEILDADIDTIRSKAQDLSQGIKYWRILVILGLIFLLIEVLLIKFWK